ADAPLRAVGRRRPHRTSPRGQRHGAGRPDPGALRVGDPPRPGRARPRDAGPDRGRDHPGAHPPVLRRALHRDRTSPRPAVRTGDRGGTGPRRHPARGAPDRLRPRPLVPAVRVLGPRRRHAGRDRDASRYASSLTHSSAVGGSGANGASSSSAAESGDSPSNPAAPSTGPSPLAPLSTGPFPASPAAAWRVIRAKVTSPYLTSTPMVPAVMTFVWCVRSPETHSSELRTPWTMTGIPLRIDCRTVRPAAAPQVFTVNHSVSVSRHSPAASR